MLVFRTEKKKQEVKLFVRPVNTHFLDKINAIYVTVQLFSLLGTDDIKVSVKLKICGDHQTTDRKTGAVTENRSICKLVNFFSPEK